MALSAAGANNASNTDLAFNFNLHAYDHQLTNRKQRQIIKVARLSKRTLKGCPIEIQEAQNLLITPTDAELTPDDLDLSLPSDSLLAVVVGMRPFCTYKEHNGKVYGKLETTQLVGGEEESIESLKNEENLMVWPYDPKALRVVCPIGQSGVNLNKPAAHTVFYAITGQNREGLCIGMVIKLDEVFFFEEFQVATAASLSARKASWKALILEIWTGRRERQLVNEYIPKTDRVLKHAIKETEAERVAKLYGFEGELAEFPLKSKHTPQFKEFTESERSWETEEDWKTDEGWETEEETVKSPEEDEMLALSETSYDNKAERETAEEWETEEDWKTEEERDTDGEWDAQEAWDTEEDEHGVEMGTVVKNEIKRLQQWPMFL